jgi:Flp pilus assembly protein TadG
VTIVESAIILIMFFMLLFGVIEAGRFLNQRQVLTNAAREGARFAVLPLSGTNTLPTAAEIQTKVDSFLAASHITGATTTVKCPLGAVGCTSTDASMSVATGPITTDYTEITVSKDFAVVTIPGFFKALNITLQGKALMRRETSD